MPAPLAGEGGRGGRMRGDAWGARTLGRSKPPSSHPHLRGTFSRKGEGNSAESRASRMQIALESRLLLAATVGGEGELHVDRLMVGRHRVDVDSPGAGDDP